MHYNRRFVGYFMGTYQAIMGGGSRWRSLPLPEAAGQRRHRHHNTGRASEAEDAGGSRRRCFFTCKALTQPSRCGCIFTFAVLFVACRT